MKTLALDTTSEYLVLAVSDGDRLLAGRVARAGFRHSEILADAAQSLLSKARLDKNAVEKIAVVAGPGSFTGIRIGLTFARTFAQTMKISAASLTSFDALAASVPAGDYKILVVIDALLPTAHYAVYDGKTAARLTEPVCENIASAAAKSGGRRNKKDKWIFAGSALGDKKTREFLAENFDTARNLDYCAARYIHPSPAALAKLAATAPAKNYNALTPLYLKEVYLRK